MSNDWKQRLGVMYSTNPDFEYETEQVENIETLIPEKQKLRVLIDKKGRNGKQVTIVKGFVGNDEDRELLCKALKQYCGVGGSVKDGEILIQGDQRNKVTNYLQSHKYNVK